MPEDNGRSELIALIIGLSALAGTCAFAIEYGESLRRFPKRRARQRGLVTGIVAATFFAVLGAVLLALMFR